MMAAVPLRLGREWEPKYLWMVGVSGLVHCGVLGILVAIGGWQTKPPPPVPVYSVELTDARALGGALPAGAPGRDLRGGATVPAPPQVQPGSGGEPAAAEAQAARIVDAAPEPPRRVLPIESPRVIPPTPKVELPKPVAVAKPPPPVVAKIERPTPPKPSEPTVRLPTTPAPRPVIAKPEPVAPKKPTPTPAAVVEKPSPPAAAPTATVKSPTPAAPAPKSEPASAPPNAASGTSTSGARHDANPTGAARAGTSTGATAAGTDARPNGKPSGGTPAGTAAPGTATGDDQYAALAAKHHGGSGGGAGGENDGGPVGSGGKDAYASAGESLGIAFASYRQRVVNAVRQVWVHDPIPGLVAAVGFNISSDGAVSGVHITRGSGNAVYDRSVVQAVQRAHLDPPPAQYADQFRDFTIRFHSEGRVGA